jgi:hypothetical protein
MSRADSNVYTLASNAGTGNGADVTIRGGIYILAAEGTWGGGNLQFQVKSPNGTYLPVGAAITVNGTTAQTFLPAGIVRVVITTASAVFAYLCGIG